MVATEHRPLKCVVVTPERALLDETVDSVVLTMYDGELGVLPGRAPLIGRLGFGELRIRHGEQTKRYYVDGGFAQIRNNVVTVLTPRAVRAEDINQQAAEQAIAASQVTTSGIEAQEAHLKAQERARAQLRVARREPGTGH